MQPQLFDQLQATLQAEGPSVAIDRLCSSLRASGDYHLLFYAQLMKKRYELGVSPIPTGPATDLPSAAHADYEEGIRNAAREVGTLLLKSGQIGPAWTYFRMIDEPGPIREALEKFEPREGEDIQSVIQLAFYEGLAPKRGFDLVLRNYGTCSAITTLSGADSLNEDARNHCIKALVRTLYHDLRSNLAGIIAERFGTPPTGADAPQDTPGVLRQLITDRDWLFADDAYHIDTSHLSSVVQMAMHLPKCVELDMARELCEYGSKLSGRFLGQDDPPFEKGYSDYRIYLGILAGHDVDKGVAYFKEKLDAADPDEIGTYPAETLVSLLLKLGRGAEALEVSRKHLSRIDGRPMSCPNLNELCQKLGDYQTLAETAKEQGDPVHYLAGLIAARK